MVGTKNDIKNYYRGSNWDKAGGFSVTDTPIEGIPQKAPNQRRQQKGHSCKDEMKQADKELQLPSGGR